MAKLERRNCNKNHAFIVKCTDRIAGHEEPILQQQLFVESNSLTREISNITRLRNRFGDRLSILTGVDTLGMESILMGADGWVAGLVCAFPAETVAVYALSRAGKVEEALEIYRWFLPLLELDISPQLVQNIKLAEVATELGSETVRKPRLPLVGAERKRVLSIIEEGMRTRPTLPKYKHLL